MQSGVIHRNFRNFLSVSDLKLKRKKREWSDDVKMNGTPQCACE